MTAAFVPLVPGALRLGNSSAATRLKTSASFAPTTSASLKPEEPAQKIHADHAEPKITLERQGEIITHIRVQCGCGKVIELKCEY
jgi:hypothetical protein